MMGDPAARAGATSPGDLPAARLRPTQQRGAAAPGDGRARRGDRAFPPLAVRSGAPGFPRNQDEPRSGPLGRGLRGGGAAGIPGGGGPAPDLAVLHHNLGNALRLLGRTVEARAAYLKAIRLDPGIKLSHVHIAMTLKGEGLAGRGGEVVQAGRGDGGERAPACGESRPSCIRIATRLTRPSIAGSGSSISRRPTTSPPASTWGGPCRRTAAPKRRSSSS